MCKNIKNNRIIPIILILIILLAACAPSPQAVQAAIVKTQAAWTPSPSPTNIPFASLDIEDQLIITGDLPIGFSASQVRYTPGSFTKAAPTADYCISQLISFNNRMGGILDVLLYEDIKKVKIAYQSILSVMIMIDSKNAGVGEESIASNDFRIPTTDLAFIRCHAVVHIQLIGSSNQVDVISYGQRLDKRLQLIACRP